MSIQSLTIYPAIKLSKLLLTLENGSRPPGGVGQVRNGIPSLGAEHISTDGKFSLANIKFIPEDFFNRMSRGIIKKHDVLVVKDGATTGKTAFVDDNFPFEKAAVNEHVFILRPDQELLLSEFLFFFLYSAWGQAQIEREFHGGAIGGINQTFADHLEIPLPPLPEQRRIAAILRQADLLRQWRKTTLNIANYFLSALYENLFGAIALDPTKQIAIDAILQKYSGIVTGPFGTQLKVGELVANGNPVFGIENVQPNRFVSKVSKFITDEKFEDLIRYRVLPNDVLLTRMGTIGRACVVPQDVPEKSIISYHLFRLRPDVDNCLPKFLAATLNYSPFVAQQLKNFAAGAVMSGLNADTVRSIRIPRPLKEQQANYVQVVDAFTVEIEKLEKSNVLLEELFASLVSRSFTGELTDSWRKKHKEELQRAAVERDQKLGLRGETARWIDAKEGRLTPEEEEQLRQALGQFAVNINEVFASSGAALSPLADINTHIVEPLLQSVRQSLQDDASIQPPLIPPVSRESVLQYIDNLPVPQEKRAIIETLDITTLRALKLAGTYPAYFTADDLEAGEFGGITTLQAEASLRLLQALGFVKLVQLDGLLRYRLIHENDVAAPPPSLQP